MSAEPFKKGEIKNILLKEEGIEKTFLVVRRGKHHPLRTLFISSDIFYKVRIGRNFKRSILYKFKQRKWQFLKKLNI